MYGALIATLTALTGAVCGATAGVLIGVAALFASRFTGRSGGESGRTRALSLLLGIALAAAAISIVVCGLYTSATLIVFLLLVLSDWVILSAWSTFRLRRRSVNMRWAAGVHLSRRRDTRR